MGSFAIETNISIAQEASSLSESKIDDIKVYKSDNEFLLHYTSDYDMLTIYNLMGQQIGAYYLPSSGEFVLSLSDLGKGAYILKFKGKAEKTIKIVR